jgi:ABC-type Na+ efflux pump permease subunit
LFTVGAFFARDIASGVNGFQVSIGLLLACVGAATALAEERAQGGLDVVLVTPLDSRRIVLGKWWGAFRIVPRLAILPGLLVLSLGLARESWPVALAMTALVVGLVLAYGAMITGLGLVIAIAQPRQGRAVALMVACYLGLTVVYPAIVLPIMRGHDLFLVSPSPFFGMMLPTAWLVWRGGPWSMYPGAWCALLAVVAAVGFILLRVALAMFDRGLGRVVDRSRPVERKVLTEIDFIADPSV